jgi:hypothetical protein
MRHCAARPGAPARPYELLDVLRLDAVHALAVAAEAYVLTLAAVPHFGNGPPLQDLVQAAAHLVILVDRHALRDPADHGLLLELELALAGAALDYDVAPVPVGNGHRHLVGDLDLARRELLELLGRRVPPLDPYAPQPLQLRPVPRHAGPRHAARDLHQRHVHVVIVIGEVVRLQSGVGLLAGRDGQPRVQRGVGGHLLGRHDVRVAAVGYLVERLQVLSAPAASQPRA